MLLFAPVLFLSFFKLPHQHFGFIRPHITKHLIFLFNYFVNYYILTPLIKIGRGISLYLKAGKRYDLKLENDDELAELNDNVAQLIDSNRQLQKQ